jgi:diguanylate cyclase (GGDEF)-like protein
VRFAACYFDLNNFKPFNDSYGYWRGDEMIKLAARVIQAACDPSEDFVGHVGGDDFVVLFQSDDWMARCRRIVAEFNQQARALFDAEDVRRDGFESEDRQGCRARFALTTIAVGAVVIEHGRYCTPESVASAAAAAKKVAKQSRDGMHFEPSACACLTARQALSV